MSTLNELAAKYGTDKQYINHNYIKMYEQLFKTIEIKNLLEIGFGPGASIKMWIEYLPNAQIHCIEYFDKEYTDVWKSPSTEIEKLNLIRGDSTKNKTWEDIPDNLDVIIDDGSHFPKDQIETFLHGFSHLRSGGLYFIEDTHCNFDKVYSNTDILYPWVNEMILAQQTPHQSVGGNFYQFKNIILHPLAREIYSYHFYKSIICFERA